MTTKIAKWTAWELVGVMIACVGYGVLGFIVLHPHSVWNSPIFIWDWFRVGYIALGAIVLLAVLLIATENGKQSRLYLGVTALWTITAWTAYIASQVEQHSPAWNGLATLNTLVWPGIFGVIVLLIPPKVEWSRNRHR